MSAELPGPMLRQLLLALELLGHDPRSFAPRGAHKGSEWEQLITALETLFVAEGTARTRAVVEATAERSPGVLLATQVLAEPLQTLSLLVAAASRQKVVAISSRSAGDGLAVRFELARGQRPSRVFFQACAWFLAAIPRARGLGDADVSIERLSERELSCVVTPPSAEGRFTLPVIEPLGLEALASAFFGRDDARLPVPREVPSVTELQQRFGLTRAEARIVRSLAHGKSIKRIAEELRVSSETARTHAKRAMQKTDTHRQAELVSLVLQGER